MSRSWVVRRAIVAVATLSVLTAWLGLAARQSPAQASTTGASAADVVRYLQQITGNHVVSGQHNKEPISTPAAYTDKVRDITGVLPGLWGSDFTFGDLGGRQTMIDEAEREWAAGSLVALMWHMCPPTQAEPCSWDSGVMSKLSDEQWNELVTPGTSLYNAYLSELDRVVPYLQQLKDANVPVLWRPLHEMNDPWAWWAGHPGANGSRRLYQITHDYLAGTHRLSNLIWVWNVKDVSTSVADYYPGDAYVDVVTLDSWMSRYPSSAMYDAMVSVAHGKPMALAEVGQIPSPAQLAQQPRWTYFMCWSEYLTDPNYNSNDSIKTTYYDSRVLNQGTLGITSGGGANLAEGRPAFASSTENTATPAAAAFDADATTRWSSTYADPQWIYVDLGATHQLTGVTLTWETAYARKYQIQTSTDGQTWTTVYENDAGDGGTDTITVSATARYVKMYGWERATQYGYSLWNFAVTGN